MNSFSVSALFYHLEYTSEEEFVRVNYSSLSVMIHKRYGGCKKGRVRAKNEGLCTRS